MSNVTGLRWGVIESLVDVLSNVPQFPITDQVVSLGEKCGLPEDRNTVV